MRWLLFTARLACICNVFFIICLLARHTHFPLPQGLSGFIIIIGWVMAIIVNVILHVLMLITLAQKKETGIPRWLVIFNLFLLFFQIVYFMLS